MTSTPSHPFGPGLGYDPARPRLRESTITNRRVELPKEAYALDAGFPSDLPSRPALNTQGKAINIRVNQYKVTQWPQKDVFQYDILIGSGAEKRGKVMVVWKSKAVQDRLRSFSHGMPWLWDGNKIAWCSYNVSEQRILVDLDAEKGRKPREVPDVVKVIIRPVKTIRMAVISGYLTKQMPFESSVLEAINFLDHCMRMWPTEQYTVSKRSFFARAQARTALDNVVEAMRGVYTSIRLCDPIPSLGGPGTGLALNVDCANGTFWAAQDVHQAARNLCSARNRSNDYMTLARLLLPIPHGKGTTYSEDFKLLRKMAKLKFTVKHRGKADDKKIYTIKKFTWEKGRDFLREGLNAKNCHFELKTNKQPDGSYTPVDTTVYDYFVQRYNIHLTFWYLPLIITSRDGFYPMEVCQLVPNQKYLYKLSPEQTSAMIKFAVTRPKERLATINHGVQMLKWDKDPYLSHYGIKVDPNMTVTQARLLQNPKVQYSAAQADPGTSGRWDLRGKKFLFPNPQPLKSWGVVIIGKCIDKAAVQHFIQVFVQTYTGHGGRVENRNPYVYEAERNDDLADTVQAARHATGSQAHAMPQILLYVLPGRDSFMYERLKRNNECRFAMVSQMLNVAHVKKAQPQYCSNVCMKLNAKLGGTSCKVADSKPAKPFFSVPTMIIGADVSHATPGSPQPSMAALTMSFDNIACRYAAAVQTNGSRVEMITEANIKSMLVPLFKQWVNKVGGGRGPSHIYYFRDGVSEGQYTHVLNQEVADMKKALAEVFGPPAAGIKWTVTICSKRHHIRFFPKENDNASADKNGNSLPGTLVERDVTHPFEFDFYLCAHSAIQGTARPVHYHVILDEAKVNVNDFQRMVYHMSYQYMRSTTPVSLFPAVYYAHLASNRARAHESRPASDGARGGQKYEEGEQDKAVARAAGVATSAQDRSSQTGASLPIEARPLVPLGNADGGEGNFEITVAIRTGMWYI